MVNPYDWITKEFKLKKKRDFEELQMDTSKATSANAFSWIIKGNITMEFAKDAKRILDVGCGWGGALKYYLETRNIAHATGITPSEAQAQEIMDLNIPNLDVDLCEWQDFIPKIKYHAIISMGAFEHFAHIDDRRRKLHSTGRIERVHSKGCFCPA